MLSLLLAACRADGTTTYETNSNLAESADEDGDGFSPSEGDCDDGDATIFPGAVEECDARDNDCDDAIDEGVTTVFYVDADGDGYGDPATSAEACESSGVLNGDDCDDTEGKTFPGGVEICDERDNDCDDAIDEDVTNLWYADADGDGFGDPDAPTESCEAAGVADASDCDDTNAGANPAADETCDERDNDCDGIVDDGVLSTWYIDVDADGWGDDTVTQTACALPTGYAEDDGDCDDADPAFHPGADESDCTDATDYNCDGSVAYDDADGDGWAACTECDDAEASTNPAATETCNGVDDDCSGTADDGAIDAPTWYIDYDLDGYGSSRKTERACDTPADYAANDDDCDDTDATVSPDGIETCNEVDDDCDGTVDDGAAATTWYADLDGDGYGDARDTVDACDAPRHYIADAGDCDDADAAISPAGTETCNGADDDCDGETDEGVTSSAYTDADGDGYGDPAAPVEGCDIVGVADATDCDDADPDVHPGAPEFCMGVDADCDGTVSTSCTSCAEALAGGATTDGLVTLEDGTEVWCDQTTDGGGWTLIQRTVWDWTETSLLVTDYADWYGNTIGAADRGEVFRLSGVDWSTVGGGGEMLAVHYARDKSSYGDCEPLYYTGSGGTLTVTASAASLSISSSVYLTNDSSLSTTDAGPSTTCVNDYDAVPWFYSYCCTTCPSFMGSYWTDEAHPMASYIDTTADLYGRTTADVCPSGAPMPNENGSSYDGINVMEYYLR